ncbi:hypothetical protein HJFPF1_02700 [Paramyrothecium foliicola]|nr:hypothetical protein HJFPF1_02700 [Paramyrothecium foliicola]
MASYARRPKYENKRPTLVLADRDHGLRDVDDRLLYQLTSMLRFVSIGGSIEPTLSRAMSIPESWLENQRTQSNGLDHSLRRPTSLFTRAAIYLGRRGVPFCPGGANLCSSHQVLDPRIIRNFLVMVMDECTVRSDRFRNADELCIHGPVKAWLIRLEAVTATWLGKNLYARIYGPSHPTPTLRFLEGHCEACMLAVVGGDYQILRDLYAGLLARQAFVKEQKNGHKYRAPRLLRIVKSWMAHCPLATRRCLEDEGKALSQKILNCRRAIVEHESRALAPGSSNASTSKSRYVVLTSYGVSVPYPVDWYSARLAALVKANATASCKVRKTLYTPMLAPFGKRLRHRMSRRRTVKRLRQLKGPLVRKVAAIKQDLATRMPAGTVAASRSTIGTKYELDSADNTNSSSQTLVEDDGMSLSIRSMSVVSAMPAPLRLRHVHRRITDTDRVGHSPSVQSLAGVICGDDLLSPLTKLSHGDFSTSRFPPAVCKDPYVPAQEGRATNFAIKRKPVPTRVPAPLPLNIRPSESETSNQPKTTSSGTNWAPSTMRMLPAAPPFSNSCSTDSIIATHPRRACSTASRRQHAPSRSSASEQGALGASNRHTTEIARGENNPQTRQDLVDTAASVRTVRRSICGPGAPPSSWM